jgi:isoquinoline 1-oxidoreductase subunit alpha
VSVIAFELNGRPVSVDVDADTPLLWVLRDVLGFTGTKFGCGRGLCGCCTVHVSGQAVHSCVVPVTNIKGLSVTTIEGLGSNSSHPVVRAWLQLAVPQCGYCQGGQIMTAAALLAHRSEPTDDDIDDAMSGVLCRCGTYGRIRAAIRLAATLQQQGDTSASASEVPNGAVADRTPTGAV